MRKIAFILIILFTSNLYAQDLFLKAPQPGNKIELRLPKIYGDGINLRDGTLSSNEKLGIITTSLILIPTTLSIIGVIKEPDSKQLLYGTLAYDCIMATFFVVTIKYN